MLRPYPQGVSTGEGLTKWTSRVWYRTPNPHFNWENYTGHTLCGISHSHLRCKVIPRTFVSPDPEVATLANTIEARYPGHVQGVNLQRGGVEIDIELANAIVEVKSGTGAGLGRQVTRRLFGPANPTKKPVIGYAVRLGPHAAREINRRGGIAAGGIASDVETLLIVVRP